MTGAGVNYLHLDFKGCCPDFESMFSWLEFFRRCGFDGIVFEYDCRIGWKTFPGSGSPRYTHQEAVELVACCEKLGLEAIPLIQIQGHVEWLLKHEKYAHLREMNSFQFCPSHPETLPLLKRWLDEVLTIFPNAKHIHLGGDEVESLGICPVCKARGKAEVYLAHARAMTEYAVSKGIVPILWGDMFIQENLSAESLPEETVLVDWKYWGRAPYRSTLTLEKSGRTVWGASAILQSWYDFHCSLHDDMEERLGNIRSWRNTGRNVIHTTWGRPSNMWNLLPLWSGAIPLFHAAGGTLSKEFEAVMLKLDNVLRNSRIFEMEAFLDQFKEYKPAGKFEQDYISYWCLGLRFQILSKRLQEIVFGRETVHCAQKYVGTYPRMEKRFFQDPVPVLEDDFRRWGEEMLRFCHSHRFSDSEEFVEEKLSICNLLKYGVH